MSFTNDRQAFCLANTYGFMPPRILSAAYKRTAYAGKYEPDHHEGEAERFMVLAHVQDRTNCLVKYEPENLDI